MSRSWPDERREGNYPFGPVKWANAAFWLGLLLIEAAIAGALLWGMK